MSLRKSMPWHFLDFTVTVLSTVVQVFRHWNPGKENLSPNSHFANLSFWAWSRMQICCSKCFNTILHSHTLAGFQTDCSVPLRITATLPMSMQPPSPYFSLSASVLVSDPFFLSAEYISPPWLKQKQRRTNRLQVLLLFNIDEGKWTISVHFFFPTLSYSVTEGMSHKSVLISEKLHGCCCFCLEKNNQQNKWTDQFLLGLKRVEQYQILEKARHILYILNVLGKQ